MADKAIAKIWDIWDIFWQHSVHTLVNVPLYLCASVLCVIMDDNYFQICQVTNVLQTESFS